MIFCVLVIFKEVVNTLNIYLNERYASLRLVIYYGAFHKVTLKSFCCGILLTNRGILVTNLILGCLEFDFLSQEFFFIVTFKVF